jgi:hypothetical protein
MQSFDRYTQFTDLAAVVHLSLRRGLPMLVLLFLGATAWLFFNDNAGWAGFSLLSAGTIIALAIWKGKGVGLPLVPVIALQHCISYGTPILGDNPTLEPYPAAFVTQSGLEVFLFMVTMAVAWRLGMEFFHARPGYSYALKAFNSDNSNRSVSLGLGLISIATAYNVLNALNLIWPLLSLFPAGTQPVVSAMMKAITMAGYFLMAMTVGSNGPGNPVKVFFWVTFAINSIIIASSLLLSSATTLVVSIVIGLFWSSGRLPWRFLVIMAVILSFLHLGKFEMRERYWDPETESVETSLADLPRRYSEWIEASYQNFTGAHEDDALFGHGKQDASSMVDRVNNLQNLLYAINAVEARHIPLLEGDTYRLIPPLLIPRILWPDKPRAHEGQILLNVHFERQSLAATFKTYIAWGLLAEAYGNFGSMWGAIILGLALGLIFARIETLTAFKPLLSLEGLVTFAFFIELSVSFEMAASVLTTALFQSIAIITMACVPFVHRAYVQRPEIDDDDESSPDDGTEEEAPA